MNKKLTFNKFLVFGMATLLTLSVAITAISLNTPAKAATENPTKPIEKFINVSGNSIIKVEPDMAHISVGVTTEESDSKTALANNNKLIQSVIDAVKEFKIDSKDIQTGTFNLSPRYKYDEKTGVSSIIGYTVNNTITVTVRKLEDLGKILDSAVKAGANTSTNISFDYSKRNEKYLEALKLATENAKKEAEAIASAFGSPKLTVVEVNENSGNNVYYARPESPAYSANDAYSAVPIQTGEIEISASVGVKYLFE